MAKRLTVDMDEKMHSFLKQMAAVQNLSLRQLVTKQVKAYVREQIALGFKEAVAPPTQNTEKGE